MDFDVSNGEGEDGRNIHRTMRKRSFRRLNVSRKNTTAPAIGRAVKETGDLSERGVLFVDRPIDVGTNVHDFRRPTMTLIQQFFKALGAPRINGAAQGKIFENIYSDANID